MAEPQQPPTPGSAAPGPPYGPPPVRPKGRVWPWAAGGTVLVIVVCFGGCAVVLKGLANEIDRVATTKHTIVYEVTGDGSAHSITYASTDSGGTEQRTRAKLPWRKKTTSKGLWNSYHVVARNSAEGSITCRISIDGKVVTENTSTGGYAVVTCRATSDDAKKK
ncbi:MAG: MmpS family transport accessory protein [Micromonosporaceae bacterium]